jgi:outer membrane biosynthesis protein TonB
MPRKTNKVHPKKSARHRGHRKQPLVARFLRIGQLWLGIGRLSTKLISPLRPVQAWALIAIVLTVTAGYGVLTHFVSAATYTGICSTNQNPVVCWRVNNNQVDGWPRDITGDANQQWTATYKGAVTSTWPFTSASLNTQYKGVGVYTFTNSFHNECAGTGGGNYVAMEMVSCSSGSGFLFVWMSSGYLVNVLNSDHYGSSRCVTNAGNYVDMNTNSCTTTWQQLHVTSPTPAPPPPPPPPPPSETPTPVPPTPTPTPIDTQTPTPTPGNGGGGGTPTPTPVPTPTPIVTHTPTPPTPTPEPGSTATPVPGSGGGSGGGNGSGSGNGGSGSNPISVVTNFLHLSGPSNTPAAEAPAGPPDPPSNFSAQISGDNSLVHLTWTASSDKYSVNPQLTYEIDRSLDQNSWNPIVAGISATALDDSTAAYSVHYYYRINASDQVGHTSDYATADATTPGFTSNVDANGTTYGSDDGLASVSVPAGAIPADYNCSVAVNTQVLRATSGHKIVAGPYALVCKDSNAQALTQLTGSITWTLKLKSKLNGVGTPGLSTVEVNGGLTAIKSATFDKNAQTVSAKEDSFQPVASEAPINPGFPWSIFIAVLFIGGIVMAVIIMVAMRSRKLSYQNYIRRKYYDV